jgi:hypothetical protein
LDFIADLAGISSGNERFYALVQCAVDISWAHALDLAKKGHSASPAFKKAAKAVIAVNETIGQLTAREVIELSRALQKVLKKILGLTFQEEMELAKIIRKRAIRPASLTSANNRLSQRPKKRPGRKAGSMGNLAFYAFARMLFESPMHATYGKAMFTFTKTPLSGTWIEALEVLRPYAPPRVVPKELPASTLERIRDSVLDPSLSEKWDANAIREWDAIPLD